MTDQEVDAILTKYGLTRGGVQIGGQMPGSGWWLPDESSGMKVATQGTWNGEGYDQGPLVDQTNFQPVKMDQEGADWGAIGLLAPFAAIAPWAMAGGALGGGAGAAGAGGFTPIEEAFAAANPTAGLTAGAGDTGLLGGAGDDALAGGGYTPIEESFAGSTTGAANPTVAGTGIDASAAGQVGAADAATGAGASAGGTPVWQAATGGLNQTALQAMKNIIANGGNADDWLKIGGTLTPALLGAYASSQQSDAQGALADKYLGMGAPYRDRLANLYADPSSFLTSPEVTTSVDQGTKRLAAALSIHGNPAMSGNALHTLQNYATDSLYGQLGNEKNRLANFGGLSSFNSAAPGADINAVNSGANTYNAIGSGIADIFNPRQSLEDVLKMAKGWQL